LQGLRALFRRVVELLLRLLMYDDCCKIPRKNPRDNAVSNPIRRKPCSSTSPLSLRERKVTSTLPRQPPNNGNRNAPANQAFPNELRLALQGPPSLCLADTSWSTHISIFASASAPSSHSLYSRHPISFHPLSSHPRNKTGFCAGDGHIRAWPGGEV